MKKTKLIRDQIPEIMESKGIVSKIRTSANDEFAKYLYEKLQEECSEFLKNNNPEELADLLEVIYAICDFLHISKDQLEEIRKEKRLRAGAFKKRLLLTKNE